MKLQRYKRAQRFLGFYKNHYGFEKPFRIIVDGTFCLQALESKINISEQARKYLNQEVILLTTPCVLSELQMLGRDFYGALHIAKQFIQERCGHRPCLPPERCLTKLLNKSDQKYFVGTQDRRLTESLRNLPGVPILFIGYNTLLIEKPSQSSVEKAEEISKVGTSLSQDQERSLDAYKRTLLGQKSRKIEKQAENPLMRKRKAKGPNPLSCKKKKLKESEFKEEANKQTGKTRRKNKKKQLGTDFS